MMKFGCYDFCDLPLWWKFTKIAEKSSLDAMWWKRDKQYRIVSNKRPGGVAIFQTGDVYKRQVFNAKMQCLSLFTMTRRREILAFYLVLLENKLGGRLLEGERLLETIRYVFFTIIANLKCYI